MNSPESCPPEASQFAARLLAYDAALAAGNPPDGALTNHLPDELRKGFACLEMLEQLRISDGDSEAPVTATPANPANLSRADTPAHGRGGRTNVDAVVPKLLGRFQIERMLGQGGCGVVFLAHDPVLNRPVAIKVPRPEVLLPPELRQRFVREGQAAGCLDHPNVVQVFEAGEAGVICYLAAAYCPGITLRDWLRQRGNSASPQAVAAMIATLAAAMHYAHQKGVCHRDLKPSNILLEIADRGLGDQATDDDAESATRTLASAIPKIIDLGLAKVLNGDSGCATTRSGAVLGTPRYMAPEQAQGRTEAIGPAVDIHALGIVLYELLTNRVPYQGDSEMELLRQVILVEPRSPRRLCPRVPRDLETICLKCLEKEPGQRYPSMQALAEDLKRFVEGRPIQARLIGWAPRVLKLLRRRPRAAAASGLLLVAILAVGIGAGVRATVHSADMDKALKDADGHKSRAEERDSMVRNQHYASQMRAGLVLKNNSQPIALRNLLLMQVPEPGQEDLRGFAWHYLWRSGQGFMLPGHQGPVSAITYSQSGDVCATGSTDRTIHLYDRHNGTLQKTARPSPTKKRSGRSPAMSQNARTAPGENPISQSR